MFVYHMLQIRILILINYACRPPSAFNQCLTVLEHASFACPANERHLVSLHMQAGPAHSQALHLAAGTRTTAIQQPPRLYKQPLPEWLVGQIQQMQSVPMQAGTPHHQPDWNCIQSALSVLINMTHNNETGCNAVVAAGGLRMGVDIMASSMLEHDLGSESGDAVVTPRRALEQDRLHVLTDVGPITAALGLLINLVENCSDSRLQLKAMQLQDAQPGKDVLQVLCRLMQASLQGK